VLTDHIADYDIYKDLHATFSTIEFSIEPN
jgi:hypothetical protein